ncbi:hypothetical protein CPLU01_01011 [Colletotrichum plurivorum]|uniref:Uncharacterized protein n=1 Tax=Colletotrichum plurivorum TaxID=2175906 RepID=A0A8H6NQC7_9PEZI|nr:hypothetical protein CPLU01_01011 [Colletotrichum plurivorum]
MTGGMYSRTSGAAVTLQPPPRDAFTFYTVFHSFRSVEAWHPRPLTLNLRPCRCVLSIPIHQIVSEWTKTSHPITADLWLPPRWDAIRSATRGVKKRLVKERTTSRRPVTQLRCLAPAAIITHSGTQALALPIAIQRRVHYSQVPARADFRPSTSPATSGSTLLRRSIEGSKPPIPHPTMAGSLSGMLSNQSGLSPLQTGTGHPYAAIETPTLGPIQLLTADLRVRLPTIHPQLDSISAVSIRNWLDGLLPRGPDVSSAAR